MALTLVGQPCSSCTHGLFADLLLMGLGSQACTDVLGFVFGASVHLLVAQGQVSQGRGMG